MSQQMRPSQQLSGHHACEQHELVQGKHLLSGQDQIQKKPVNEKA